MEKVRVLRVGKTMIEVYAGRNLHLFDRDQEGTKTLTNAISTDYLNNVLDWIGALSFDKVFCYHTDGYITEWDDVEGFKHVPHTNPELYYEFMERCLERKRILEGEPLVKASCNKCNHPLIHQAFDVWYCSWCEEERILQNK